MPGECLELLMPEEEPEDNRKAVDIILSFFERKLRENPEVSTYTSQIYISPFFIFILINLK